MYKFYMNKDDALDVNTLGTLIRKFEAENKPKLMRYKRYYDGEHDILQRVPGDATRPNNRIITNFCSQIVDNYEGFICGKPITYSSLDDEDITDLLECFNQNDIVNSDSVFLRNGLKMGIAYQIVYMGKDNQPRFRNLDSESVIPVYSNTLDEELLYVIYYYALPNWNKDQTRTQYAIDVYDESNVYHYKSESFFNNITNAGAPEPHYFGRVPFTVFNLNEENTCIFENILTLQDAYNEVLSDHINDFESFCDAYLVMKNVQATAEDLAEMKKNRTILIDGEDDVSYLTKDTDTTAVENLLGTLKTNIHTISASPDFYSKEFNSGVNSGVSLQYKLIGFINSANNVEAQFRKAIQDRIDLINVISNLVDGDTYNINIDFTENLPDNLTDIVDVVNGLRGLVSDETLLAQIPFVADVSEEIDRVKAENEANVSMYSFDNHTTQEVMVNEEDTEE